MTDFSSPQVRDLPDPGRPDPAHAEPRVRRHARRQVAGMLGTATALVLLSVVVYSGFTADARGNDVDLGGLRISNLFLGLTLGAGLLLAGAGTVHWSRVLTASPQVAQRRGLDDARHSRRQYSGGGAAGGLGRRRLIRNASLGALVLLPLPAVTALRGLDPDAPARRRHTVWDDGVRLLTDGGYRPIRASDVQVGEMVNVMPATFLDLPEAGPARPNERARSPVVLVRMPPEDLAPSRGRENWHVDGIVAYSKICTHVGCPVSIYERTTHHLLCPCHQATFDLADNGSVIFGPATRRLPQLPLKVDDDGFLVAQSDFSEPVGPSYWEREA